MASSEAEAFLAKAEENLHIATTGYSEGWYNACANRSYYACFQAVIAAPIWAWVKPTSCRGDWGHAFVQAQFAGQLVSRAKTYPSTLRDTLPRLLALREKADYEPVAVSEREAAHALRRAEVFVAAVRESGERQ